MITAQQARTITEEATARIERHRAAIAAAEARRLEIERPRKTAALNRRLDALVRQFIDDHVDPAIRRASDEGKEEISFGTTSRYAGHGHWNTDDTESVDTVIRQSVFGELRRRYGRIHALFSESSLDVHAVRFWSGYVALNDVSLVFHILYRAADELKARGYEVDRPEIRLQSGCKVNEALYPLRVQW